MANEIVRAAKDISEIQQVARLLAMSGYFDAKGNGEQAIAQIATKILAGREMGYGEFTSVQGIHVIQGRPAMSANLMAAAVKASPRYDYRVRQMDDNAVKVEFFERVGGKLESLGVSTFTADDAKKAGTQNMAKFGRNMMFARAMSNGVRWYCPDVFFGNAVYTPEELGAPVDGDGNVIEVEYRTIPAPAPAPTPAQPATPTQAQTTNGKTNGNHAPAADVPEVVAAWLTPSHAYDWAVSIGASDNVHAARATMTKVVDAHGGKFTRENAAEIYTAFYRDRLKRAQEKALAAIESLDDVTEVDPDGVFA